MNIQSMMAQAQKMQKEITKTKEEIDEQTFDGESQLVKIVMNGKKQILSVEISKDKGLNIDDIELIEDMIIIASKDCYKKIEKITEEKLGKYGQSLNGLI